MIKKTMGTMKLVLMPSLGVLVGLEPVNDAMVHSCR